MGPDKLRINRKKTNAAGLKGFPQRPLVSRISHHINTALASLSGTVPNLPDRIPPPNPLTPTPTIPDQTPLSTQSYMASREKYVLWTRLRSGEYTADWKGGSVPTESDVRDMLLWYAAFRLYPFPDVEYVSLMGRGRTNYFFLIEFMPNSKRGRLPQKVVLKFSLPVCPHDKLESEVATMAWVATVSPKLIPRVLLFDSYPRNPLGLEWMMMEPVFGFSFQEYTLQGSTDTGLEGFGFPKDTPPQSDRDHLSIGRGLRDFMAKVKITASGVPKDDARIGSLRIDWETKRFYTGPIVSPHFYSADRLWRKPFHGPYPSIRSYLDNYISVWREEIHDNKVMQSRLASLDIVLGRMVQRLEALPKVKWRLPLEGGRMNGWPVTISHPDPRPDNILVGEDGELVAIMGWEDATLMPIPLRTDLSKLDQFFQQFGCELIIDPMQIDLGCALPPRSELVDRVRDRQWQGRDASIILEPVMESMSGIEIAFKALMEVCERLPLERAAEREWLDKAVLAMMDRHGESLKKKIV
ncbi:Putative aminoglycoside phosphotransferase, protein kinase-like domain superfamily [Colletotrichum destructivum]|uniref:Aminoglycoside phosphotransferase, protein kinase-like domain superfamily n=1 Tax=Colletotrichum destructivum TaxID=34406 RepID=A0AAX4HWR5_9PEZI|nr:Putative aminoglycoside phosphotransferase, protein kinase-like domain superfamily [Colletotrichum destructivum]